MELAKLLDPLHGEKRAKAKKQLIHVFNCALKEDFEKFPVTSISYGKIQPNVYAMGINISNRRYIYKLKALIEALGFAELPHVNEYQNFITKAFKQNKLYLKCDKQKINKDYAIDKRNVQLRLDDPRLYNPSNQSAIKIKIQFKIVPISVKAKKHAKALKESSYGTTNYTPYRG